MHSGMRTFSAPACRLQGARRNPKATNHLDPARHTAAQKMCLTCLNKACMRTSRLHAHCLIMAHNTQGTGHSLCGVLKLPGAILLEVPFLDRLHVCNNPKVQILPVQIRSHLCRGAAIAAPYNADGPQLDVAIEGDMYQKFSVILIAAEGGLRRLQALLPNAEALPHAVIL